MRHHCRLLIRTLGEGHIKFRPDPGTSAVRTDNEGRSNAGAAIQLDPAKLRIFLNTAQSVTRKQRYLSVFANQLPQDLTDCPVFNNVPEFRNTRGGGIKTDGARLIPPIQWTKTAPLDACS